jgi:hypothetical protein
MKKNYRDQLYHRMTLRETLIDQHRRRSSEFKVPEGNSVSLNVIYTTFVSTIFFHFPQLFTKNSSRSTKTFRNFSKFWKQNVKRQKKVLELHETCRSVKKKLSTIYEKTSNIFVRTLWFSPTLAECCCLFWAWINAWERACFISLAQLPKPDRKPQLQIQGLQLGAWGL